MTQNWFRTPQKIILLILVGHTYIIVINSHLLGVQNDLHWRWGKHRPNGRKWLFLDERIFWKLNRNEKTQEQNLWWQFFLSKGKKEVKMLKCFSMYNRFLQNLNFYWIPNHLLIQVSSEPLGDIFCTDFSKRSLKLMCRSSLREAEKNNLNLSSHWFKTPFSEGLF